MALDADFHGNQIRLNVFLRLEGKIPNPPKRLRRDKHTPLLSPLILSQRLSAIHHPHANLTTAIDQSQTTAENAPEDLEFDLQSDAPNQPPQTDASLIRYPPGVNPPSPSVKSPEILIRGQSNAESIVPDDRMAATPVHREQTTPNVEKDVSMPEHITVRTRRKKQP